MSLLLRSQHQPTSRFAAVIHRLSRKIIIVWMLSASVRRIAWASELGRQKAGLPVILFS